MNDVELAALTALVASDTAEFQGCLVQLGERPWYHKTAFYVALRDELDRRGIFAGAEPNAKTPPASMAEPLPSRR